jgi:hypothetical protein
LLLAFGADLRAQCPIPPPPTSIGYNGPNTRHIYLGSNNCGVTVTYCWRVVDGVYEYLINSVTPDDDSDCPKSWDEVMAEVGGWFLLGEIDCDYVPVCPVVAQRYALVQSNCFKIVNLSGPDQPPTLSCTRCEGSYCRRVYEVCCTLGVPSMSLVSSTLIGSGGCTTEFPPIGYVLNTCYKMGDPCE